MKRVWIFNIIVGLFFSSYGFSGEKRELSFRVLQEGTQLLFDSAKKGLLEGVQESVLSYADLRARDSLGRTALHYAAQSGNYLCTAFLLGLGFEVDAVDNKGETALMVAASSGNIDCAKVLLDARANVLASNLKGDQVIHYAVNREGNEDLLLLLMSRGAQVSHQDSKGMPALHRAVFFANVSMVRFLLEELGVHYNSIDREGHKACDLASNCSSGLGFTMKSEDEKERAKAVEDLFHQYTFFEIGIKEEEASKKRAPKLKARLPRREEVVKEVRNLLEVTRVLKQKRIQQGLRRFQSCVMDYVSIIRHRKQSKVEQVKSVLLLKYKKKESLEEIQKIPKKKKKGLCNSCILS